MVFKVASTCCNQCLFGPNKIVSDLRKAEILESCAHNDSHFVCHKATIKGDDVCCRGFYESHTSQMIRIAQRIGAVEFVNVAGDTE